MNETQKAALLLSGLQTKTIDTILSRLDSETARMLLRELRSLPVVSETEKNKIAEEFLHTLSARKQRFSTGITSPITSSMPSGGTYRRPFSASGLRPQTGKPEKFNFLNQLPPEMIAGELADERPQIIAAVLSHLAVTVKQNVLPQLPQAVRNEVAAQLSQNNGIHIAAELMTDIESALRERFEQRSAEEFNELNRLSNAELSTLFHRVNLMTAMLSLVGAEPSFIQRVLGRFSPTEEAEMKKQLRQLNKIDEDDVMIARIKVLNKM